MTIVRKKYLEHKCSFLCQKIAGFFFFLNLRIKKKIHFSNYIIFERQEGLFYHFFGAKLPIGTIISSLWHLVMVLNVNNRKSKSQSGAAPQIETLRNQSGLECGAAAFEIKMWTHSNQRDTYFVAAAIWRLQTFTHFVFQLALLWPPTD